MMNMGLPRVERLLDVANPALVALVERPFLDALRAEEPRLGQHTQVLARGRWGDAELVRDEEAADAVAVEVAVLLRWKVGGGILEPLQNLEPRLARKRLEDRRGSHRRQDYDRTLCQFAI